MDAFIVAPDALAPTGTGEPASASTLAVYRAGGGAPATLAMETPLLLSESLPWSEESLPLSRLLLLLPSLSIWECREEPLLEDHIM